MTQRELIMWRISDLQLMRYKLRKEHAPHEQPPSIDWLNMTIAEHMKDLEGILCENLQSSLSLVS